MAHSTTDDSAAPAASAPAKGGKLGAGFKRSLHRVAEIGAGLRSEDGPTRRMSALFFLSLAGMVGVAGYAVVDQFHRRSERRAAVSAYEAEVARMNDFFAKQAEEAKRRNLMLDLGEYQFSVRRDESLPKMPGEVNVGEMQLFAQCDAPETCSYLQENLVSVRGQVIQVFQAVDRDGMISREGKRKLKKQLLDKLNQWLPRGKVENLYFGRLLIQ